MQSSKNVYSEMLDVLKLTAPGTPLREGLENVLRANTGGLIVFGEMETIRPLMRGGFNIRAEYSPAHLYELAKMDGAIVLSADGKQIISANIHLTPDATVPSSETGIRHRTAEQTARQTGALVISISQRRNIITLYQGDNKYTIKDTGVLLNMANQALGTLEKYKEALTEALLRLSVQEFDNVVTLPDVLQVVQRAEMFKRIENMLSCYIVELGDESHLIQMQVDELSNSVDSDERLTLRDYMIREKRKDDGVLIEEYLSILSKYDNEDLFDLDRLAKDLNLSAFHDKDKRVILEPRGYRMLNKIPRLPNSIIENIVEVFANLQEVLSATTDDLDDVVGVGPARARQISLGLERIRSQLITESNWT